MDKIEWSESSDGRLHRAYVGNSNLTCYAYTDYRRRWWAKADVCGRVRQGPIRHSLDEAKADAVDLCKNMLEDLMHGLKKEMASFGIKDIWDE